MENNSDSSPFGSSSLRDFPSGKSFPKRESNGWKKYGLRRFGFSMVWKKSLKFSNEWKNVFHSVENFYTRA